MKELPCIDTPIYKLCDACQQELQSQIHELLTGMGELGKTMKEAPHTLECATLQPCNCWKSKIEEIYNG